MKSKSSSRKNRWSLELHNDSQKGVQRSFPPQFITKRSRKIMQTVTGAIREKSVKVIFQKQWFARLEWILRINLQLRRGLRTRIKCIWSAWSLKYSVTSQPNKQSTHQSTISKAVEVPSSETLHNNLPERMKVRYYRVVGSRKTRVLLKQENTTSINKRWAL